MNARAVRVVGPVLLAALLAGCAGNGAGAPEAGDGSAPTASSSVTPPGTPSPSAGTPSAPSFEPNILLFSATGTARLQSVTYEVQGRTVRETSAKLPWRKTIELPSGTPQEWSLVIKHRSGGLKVVVSVNGRVVTQGGGGGTGTGTASFSGRIAA
ncbi:hypothetical protein [Plantactinospora sp. CA-290183]|uniref:hypothetical protein n=1 Tax=Plantactinospora sp. CA-290183 TaxID=3240006 RepID=UPI003D90CC37